MTTRQDPHPLPQPPIPMHFPSHSRTKRLIQVGLQLRLIGAFGGLVALALLLQFLVMGWFMSRAVGEIEGAGGQLATQVPGMLLSVLGVSLALLLPPFIILGTLITFRIAGPVYRFEKYLRDVAAGTQLGPCKIRDNDELHSLCEAINLATEPVRRRTHRDDEHEAAHDGEVEERASA